jgi:hypothetical protein
LSIFPLARSSSRIKKIALHILYWIISNRSVPFHSIPFELLNSKKGIKKRKISSTEKGSKGLGKIDSIDAGFILDLTNPKKANKLKAKPTTTQTQKNENENNNNNSKDTPKH